jgi:hypothetical protein
VQSLEQKLRLIALSADLGSWIQLDSPGFVPNRRQHRMFGFAVLQAAAVLRRHVELIRMEGVGVEIPNSMSSKCNPTRKPEERRDVKGE